MAVPKPSARYRPYVQAILACGHWQLTDRTVDGGSQVVLRHKRTGKTVTYAVHDGGNEWNAARNMAKQAGDVCGCTFIQPRNRRRSRRRTSGSGFNLERAVRLGGDFGRRADELQDQRTAAIAEFDRLRELGTEDAAQQARFQLRTIRHLEEQLVAMWQPCQRFDPLAHHP